MKTSNLIEKSRLRRRLPDPQTRRFIREQAHLTQQDVAAVLNVAQPAVARWESGDRTPRGAALDAYAELLDRLKREVLA